MTPALTPAQLAALKADILADGALGPLPNTADNAYAIAAAYNAPAAGPFIVWKTFVSLTHVGNTFDGGELAGLTTANATRLQTIAQWSPMGINPSLADKRSALADIFSVGGVTAARLLALWKRSATRAEKLFATGTGSDAAPATMSAEGLLSHQEVMTARDLA